MLLIEYRKSFLRTM